MSTCADATKRGKQHIFTPFWFYLIGEKENNLSWLEIILYKGEKQTHRKS